MLSQQEYILSDKLDDLANNLYNDLIIWSSEVATEDYCGSRAKSLSTMLASSFYCLYDHPQLLKKYPNGFYGENSAFIPFDMYQRMHDCETLAVKSQSLNSYWNFSGLIFIQFLIKMIENKYSLTFTQKEKDIILIQSTEYSFYKNKYIVGAKQADLLKFEKKYSHEFVQNIRNESFTYCSHITSQNLLDVTKEIFQNGMPCFVSNNNIASYLEDLGLKSADFVRSLTLDSSFIDYALLKNNDLYEKNHPFNALIGKINIPNQTIDLLNIHKENYETLYDLPHTKSYSLYNAFEKLTYDIVSQSKNIDSLLRNIYGIWSNLALETNDLQFEKIVNILRDNCIKKFADSEYENHLDINIATQISVVINGHHSCSMQKRSTLIENLTQYSLALSTVRTILFESATAINK